MSNFEAYLDYDEISQEMANDLHETHKAYREAAEALCDEGNIDNAKRMMETFTELTEVASAIEAAIFTQPVMVHIAGSRKEETNPDNPMEEGILQRCTRCASILHFWQDGLMGLPEGATEPQGLSENDIPWWDEGDVVAKHQDSASIGMYEVDPDRELKRHEIECVSLEGLEGDFSGE